MRKKKRAFMDRDDRVMLPQTVKPTYVIIIDERIEFKPSFESPSQSI